MEHGQIVKFHKSHDSSPYITIKYRDKYLFLNINTLNRRCEFTDMPDADREEINFNILEIPIKDIIDMYIDNEELEQDEIQIYYTGTILKSKFNGKYYSMILVRDEEGRGEQNYYLIDLETFELKNIAGNTKEEQFGYVEKNYHCYKHTRTHFGLFFFSDLKINIR